jgi:thiamine transporter
MFLHSLLSTVYAVERFEPIAKWLTIGILAALLITGAILFFCKRSAVGKFAKIALIGSFCYLLILGIVFFCLDIAKNYSDSYAEENWLDKPILIKFVLIPLLVLCCVTLLSIVAYVITSKYRSDKKRLVLFVGGSLCVAMLLTALACITVYYNKKIANDGYYNSDTATVRQASLYVLSIVSILLIFGLSRFDKQKLHFNARSLAYAGICTAMSYALSYIKLWDMPQGGSITLVSLLPLMLYSYIFGAKKGVFVGFTYGVLQALQDPWLIHPAQFLLDYPIAFSAAGLAGLFKNIQIFGKLPQLNFTLGAILAGCMRFICHVLSGTLAFEAYAAGQNPWLYSLAYNSYVFLDVALVIVAGIFVLSSSSFLKTITKLQKI